MDDSLYRQLRELHTQAYELCRAIEQLPASERQTRVVTMASSACQALQDWWQEIERLEPIVPKTKI